MILSSSVLAPTPRRTPSAGNLFAVTRRLTAKQHHPQAAQADALETPVPDHEADQHMVLRFASDV